MWDEILKQFDLEDKDLDTPGHSGEREVLQSWVTDLQQKQLTVERVKENIRLMRSAVERELIKTPETETVWLFFQRPNRAAILLKARMYNYMELEAFLTAPEKAKEFLDQRIKNFKSKVV